MRISDWSSDVCSSDLRDVAGVEPALTVRGLGIGLEITLDDPRTAALKPSARLAVAWQHIALIVDDAQLDAERRATLPRDDVDALVEAHLVPVPRPFAHRPDRRSFGHSPGMADVDSRFHQSEERRVVKGVVHKCKYG